MLNKKSLIILLVINILIAILVINCSDYKIDAIEANKEIKKKLNELKKIGKKAIPISIIDNKSIKQVEKILRDLIKQKIVVL